MSALRRAFHSRRGQALVEFTLTLPLLIVLGLGAIEFGNMINAYLVLTHLTREGANLTSREPGAKGVSTWADNITNDVNAAISAANPVIKNTTPTEQDQWVVIYSMIVKDTSAAACGGVLTDGQPDNYRVVRATRPTWSVSPQWTYGSLGNETLSKIGAHGDCASDALGSSVLALPDGLTLHAVEVFYDYGPSLLTPVGNFIGNIVPATFYTRTIFIDVSGNPS